MTSIRNALGRLSPNLLVSLLGRHQISLVLAEKPDVGAALGALDKSWPGTRGSLLKDLERIDRLSDDPGREVLNEHLLPSECDDLQTAHDRALWLLLNDDPRFAAAEAVLYADEHRYGRQWTAFAGPLSVAWTEDAIALERFIASLKEILDTPNIDLEFITRNRPEMFGGDEGTETLQITIYSEDRPDAVNAFQDGKRVLQTRRDVIEASVAYEPSTGIIECISRRKDTRREIVESFGKTLLGASGDFEVREAKSYDLSVLKRRQAFESEPSDGIDGVWVAMLRLTPIDSGGERIVVETGSRGSRDIWSVVDRRLGVHTLENDFDIGQARIVIRYRPVGSARTRLLPITISYPHRSSIKEQTEFERLVANKYLPRWGLIAQRQA